MLKTKEKRGSSQVPKYYRGYLKAQAYQITGDNISISNIWIPYTTPWRGTSMREHYVCRRFSERNTHKHQRTTSYFVELQQSK
ncbi:predicted protein [Lichtheimia corymbifera JMRC:FSU:9682]|uniref:Uncharacterized protein n=1 Tax=Lichtheimia corymbifera JMRC:FSU:9682 TaxID=1263082 RepID=A0A068RQC3_9FUNG|nr:predicted protein [Lichtheimia corymbifera JMRC:FSU:9682]